MGWNAALRTRRSVAGLRRVLSVELVAAAQGIDLRAPLRPSPATAALVAALRSRVARLDADRFLHDDLVAAEEWTRSDHWRTAAAAITGPLA
jgi:histidine ammonia-lyase